VEKRRERLVREWSPGVVCIQETKLEVVDDFPSVVSEPITKP